MIISQHPQLLDIHIFEVVALPFSNPILFLQAFRHKIENDW